MGSAMWAPSMESWIGCAICGQREKLSSRVGVVLKRSPQENCLQARRPSFCEKMSRMATPSLATMASPRTLHLRSLSVRWSAIHCLCWKRNSACQTMNLLSEDVTLWADGGGKIKQAALRPIRGRDAGARFSLGTKRFWPENARVELEEVNGQIALIIRAGGQVFSVLTIDSALSQLGPQIRSLIVLLVQ